MPFQNYSDLYAEIASLVVRGDLRPKIPTWVELAEKNAVLAVRDLPFNQYKFSGTMTSGSNELELPAGITEVLAFQIDTTPVRVLKSANLTQMATQRSRLGGNSSTFPDLYAFRDRLIVELSPTPQDNHPYTIWWRGAAADVTVNSFTSQLLEEAPMILYYGAAVHSAAWSSELENFNLWVTLHEDAIQKYAQFLSRKQDEIQLQSYQGTPPDAPRWFYE